ncbi:MAG: dicarboxylate/amino acid:cation symporter [bacterium]
MKLESLNIKLHTQIIISIIMGITVGVLLQEKAIILKPLAEIFIRLLNMIIIPIIFATLIVGITSLGNIKTLGRLGSKTFIYYIITSLIAVIIGLTIINLFNPGKNADLIIDQSIIDTLPNTKMNLTTIIEQIIPKNFFKAIVEENMVSIIFFTIFFGMALNYLGKAGKPILDFVNALNEVILKITEWIMTLAPIGVFALIATLIGEMGLGTLRPLAIYMLSVIVALSIHLLIIIPIILYFFGKYSPKKFFVNFFPALATAFSTDSSIATLPVTIESLEKNIGVSNKVTSFVAPLGATINMDGTALYEAMAALFIAQAYNIQLTLTEQLIVALTAILASIGAAGIPSAGLITLIIVLQAVNLPLEGIGILLAVDRVLDMCRTTVNVAGDACGSIVIAKMEGERFK